MSSSLLNRLRETDKKGLFVSSQTSVSYPTGFLPFDYRNGYTVEVVDTATDEPVTTYNSIGLVGGTFTTIIGKTGVAKSTLAMQMSWSVVKQFGEDAFVLLYDLEQTINYTRVKNVTGAKSSRLEKQFIIRQEKNYIEDIFDSIMMIANEKEKNKKEYTYLTGLLDEFNRPISTYVPTIVIIDSLPTLASKEAPEEMEGQTAAMRVAKHLGQFYKKLMPIIKTYNISVIAVNHINTKIDINAFAKTQAQAMYLKIDESVPGGNGPLYYANNILKIVSSDKYTEEKDGLDGFKANVIFLKSRTNKAGQFTSMIYEQSSGYDETLTLLNFADDCELVGGKNPRKFLIGYEDLKFDSRKFRKHCRETPELLTALFKVTDPYLKALLSVKPDTAEDLDADYQTMLQTLAATQEME